MFLINYWISEEIKEIILKITDVYKTEHRNDKNMRQQIK